jgi:hypothetical protein
MIKKEFLKILMLGQKKCKHFMGFGSCGVIGIKDFKNRKGL